MLKLFLNYSMCTGNLILQYWVRDIQNDVFANQNDYTLNLTFIDKCKISHIECHAHMCKSQAIFAHHIRFHKKDIRHTN
jgi:hypothetical protein